MSSSGDFRGNNTVFTPAHARGVIILILHCPIIVKILVEEEIFVYGEEAINMRVILNYALIKKYGALFLTSPGILKML